MLVLSQLGLSAEGTSVAATAPPAATATEDDDAPPPAPPPSLPAASAAALRPFCTDQVFSRFVQGLLRVLNDQRYPFKRGAASHATIVRLLQILSFLCTAGAASARQRRCFQADSRSRGRAGGVDEAGAVVVPELFSNDRKVLLEIIVRESGNLPASSQVLFFYIKLADTILLAYVACTVAWPGVCVCSLCVAVAVRVRLRRKPRTLRPAG